MEPRRDPRPHPGDPRLRLGVDVGGTFTDVVTVDPAGAVTLAKVPSTPADQSVGVLAGWAAAARAAGLDAADVAVFAHGTTVATNALLERRGGRLRFCCCLLCFLLPLADRQ